MADTNRRLVELAQAERLLTSRQAEKIISETERNPSLDAGELMLRRMFLTSDQLANLQKELKSSQLPGEEEKPSQAYLYASPAGVNLEEMSPPRPMAPPEEQSGREAGFEPPQKPMEQDKPQPALTPTGGAEMEGTGGSQIAHYLNLAKHWGCSDLHISAGRPAFVRLHGGIRYLKEPPLSADQTEEILFSVLDEFQQEALRTNQQLDVSLELPNLGRVRCNIFRQRLGWDGSFRIISAEIPPLESLGLPPVVKTLTEYQQGLVLVTGPAGSGKTTSVASMLQHINATREDHIITVEDPIEYVVPPARSQVTQREVGSHTLGFSVALRAALREDPDVLLVGEMRDLETISIAITAAETGHLVFGTLHTSSAPRTVSRILDVYPPEQRPQIRTMVSESIRGVLSQQLIPRRDGNGRVLALEILIMTSGVAQQIREGKTHQLASLMQSGKKIGMQLMDDVLFKLVREGTISGEEAWQRAENKSVFEQFR